jgi:PTH1 family peptidyl-tRNA hydrolase
MNRKVINALIKRFNVKISEDVVLFHDDLDLKLGTYKVVRGKFPKAHNGLLSIFNITQNSDYLFVRLGIENREDPRFPGEDFVLKKFTESELTILTEEVLGAIKDVRPYISI